MFLDAIEKAVDSYRSSLGITIEVYCRSMVWGISYGSVDKGISGWFYVYEPADESSHASYLDHVICSNIFPRTRTSRLQAIRVVHFKDRDNVLPKMPPNSFFDKNMLFDSAASIIYVPEYGSAYKIVQNYKGYYMSVIHYSLYGSKKPVHYQWNVNGSPIAYHFDKILCSRFIRSNILYGVGMKFIRHIVNPDKMVYDGEFVRKSAYTNDYLVFSNGKWAIMNRDNIMLKCEQHIIDEVLLMDSIGGL